MLVTEPILHPQTELLLNQHIAHPSQSILLIGEAGMGKLHLAQWISDKLQTDHVVIEPPEGKQNIGIDQIKVLYQHTKTGRPLCIIIADAHLMTREAQNALLKLLEEPPQNTYFILTSISEHLVLQTIRSRCQIIPITSVDTEVLLSKIPELADPEIRSLITTSGGKIGTLLTLLNNTDQYDQHKVSITTAKQFYGSNAYQRLALLHTGSFEKQWSVRLLDMLALILDSLIQASAEDSSRLQRLHTQALAVEQAARALSIAGNPKIHMTRLALAL